MSKIKLCCLMLIFLLSSFMQIIAEEKKPVEEKKENKTLKSVSPIIGYNPTDKFILGGAYFVSKERRDIPGYYFQTQVMGNSNMDYAVLFGVEKWTASPYVYKLNTALSNFSYYYYGEGTDTKADDEVSVEASSLSADLGVDYNWDKHLSSGTFIEYRTKEEGVSSIAVDKKIYQEEKVFGLGLTASYDMRDNIFSSKKGHYSKVLLRYVPTQENAGTEINDFWQSELDLRYFKTLDAKSVVALRLSGGYSDGDPNYLYRYALGGPIALRGYFANRFRGKKFYATQGEYRYRMNKIMDFVLFTDLGDITDDEFKTAKTSYGYGLRFGLPPDYLMKLRFDFGFSEDQAGLYVMFGEVF